MKKNIILADCDELELSEFRDSLIYDGKVFVVESTISNWERTGNLSELKRYLTYFRVALSTFLKRGNYQVIVGWQQFYALIFCFYCSLFHVKKKNIVIAFNFTYKEKKGKFRKVYKWFMKMCVNPKYLDGLHVPSANYADCFSKEFGFPRDRILVAPFGINDCYSEFKQLKRPKEYKNREYAFAIGRSNRDFDFLIRAWNEMEFPLIIASDTYKKDKCENRFIEIHHDITEEESHRWIEHCKCVIIPIENPEICSGDTVLLTSMACGKIVVVTSPSTLGEMYVKDGVNGYLLPKNEEIFLNGMKKIISEDSEVVKENARNCYLNSYSRKSLGNNLQLFFEKIKTEKTK